MGDPELLSQRLDPGAAAGRCRVTPTDLRHTFASRLLAAGIALIEVSAWMGHGLRAGGHEITNTTTRVYAHATGEWRRAALDELATLIADADPGREQRAT